MKISQREKYLLTLIGCVLVGVLYYQFMYVPQQEKLAQKELELQDTQIRYDEVMQNIATLEARQEKIKGISANVNELTYDYYPTLIQERLILELDDLIKESDVTATLSFSPITSAAVAPLTAPGAIKPESSLKPFVDEYDVLTQEGATSSDKEVEDSKNPQEEAPEASTDTEESTTGATAEILTVGVTFNGSYENVKAFIDEIQAHRYNIIITNLSLSPQTEKEVAGSMNLEFYGVPKLNEQDQAYLEWTLEGDYGKEYPFSTGAATGAYSESENDLLSLGIRVNDLMMVVRSNTSDLPNVTIGQSNDESLESYVYSDKEGNEKVDIYFVEEDGAYYFRYNTSEGEYPEGMSKGQVFKPKQETINLQILSEPRVAATDDTAVTVTIHNQTELTVDVQIKNDDAENPRVTVKTEGNAVNVTKK